MTTTTVMAPTRAKKPRVARTRTEKNEKFANDGSYASVEALLHKLAIKCYARVQAMGLSMEFGDVLQEMNVSYVKSTHKWNAQGGAMFSTYCTTVCLNNFNHAIAKMERERGLLLIGSEGEFTGEAFEDDSSATPFMDSQPAADIDQPDARLEGAQAMQRKLASLSQGGRTLIGLLLQSEQNQEPTPKLRELARAANLQGDELRRVKLEILTTFGVRWS
jgi:hypothetical protein